MEEKKERKKSEELLAEVYRNCQLALESISDVLPEVEDEALREEITRQHEEYEKISAKAAVLAKDKALEVKEPNPMKKAMMWSAIKLNTAFDDSRNHIAELMIKGTNMGVTSLYAIINDKSSGIDEEIKAYAEKLKDLEEKYEEALKKFL